MTANPHLRLRIAGGLLLLLFAPLASAQQQQAPHDDQRVDQLENELTDLRQKYQDLLQLTGSLKSRLDVLGGNLTEAGDEYYIPRSAAEFEQQDLPGSWGNIYTKPFLTRFGENTYLGGYVDLEYTDPGQGGGDKAFDQHRLVPLLYADVSEHVKFASEVEFEHGHELEVEFAQLDFLLNDHANLRAGIQLLPLGKFNEVHDSPIQEVTFRPLVDTYVIPTTLRDAGLGLWGDVCDTVSYQATVTNGFKGLDANGNSAITTEEGLLGAAPYEEDVGEPYENINDDLAWTGRLAWRPDLGLELGASAHTGAYDEKGDNNLTITALDATVDGKAVSFLPDNLELLYEGAWADIQRDAFAKANGVVGDMDGYYVQANVRFTPDFLEDWKTSGGLAEDGAHFTFVTRYDALGLESYGRRRTTLGLNYRPNSSTTVIKLDYLMDADHGSQVGTHGANAWALSFASYF